MTYKEWHSKYVAKDGEKVYNQGMSSIDLMAKQRSFVVGYDIRVKAKQLSGTEFDFWAQDNTKKIRDAVVNVQGVFRQLPDYSKPTVVFLKKSRLSGFAGYNYKQDSLFISDALSSEKYIINILSDNYFASKDLKDILIHELTHKKHWDSAKEFYKNNKKRYNSLEEAKASLDSQIISYVRTQLSFDYNYLAKISDYADISAFNERYNEVIAEAMVADNEFSRDLQERIKEVLKWK